MLSPQEKRLLLLLAGWLVAGSFLDIVALRRPAAVLPLVGEGRFADLLTAGEAEPETAPAAPPQPSSGDSARGRPSVGGSAPGAGSDGPRPRGRARVYDARGRLELNLADANELDLIEGIGPALAARILAERARRGGFRRAEDLLAVRGIGPRTLAKLLPHIAVSALPDSSPGALPPPLSPQVGGRNAR